MKLIYTVIVGLLLIGCVSSQSTQEWNVKKVAGTPYAAIYQYTTLFSKCFIAETPRTTSISCVP